MLIKSNKMSMFKLFINMNVCNLYGIEIKLIIILLLYKTYCVEI